jgi:hypothetical protein
MWIDRPNPMIPPVQPVMPVPPREIAWIIFKSGLMRWIPDDLLAPLLIAAIPGLLFVVLTYFATRAVQDDRALPGD